MMEHEVINPDFVRMYIQRRTKYIVPVSDSRQTGKRSGGNTKKTTFLDLSTYQTAILDYIRRRERTTLKQWHDGMEQG